MDVEMVMARALFLAADDAHHDGRRLTAWRRAARVDLTTLFDRDIAISLLPVAPVGRTGRFDFVRPGAADAVEAVVIEVKDTDDESPVDFLAFDARRPSRWWRLLNRAEILGGANVVNPATWSRGSVLQLHRTPLGWLRGGCTGAALLEPETAWRWLTDLPGPVATEDLQHGRDLAVLLGRHADRRKILVPTPKELAA